MTVVDKAILLVEDNSDDEKLALRALEKSNVVNEVVVVRDGEQALEYLITSNKKIPAVVLLDLKLPKVSGLELLEQIRGNEKTKLVPVVILTSSNEEEDMWRSYELGANSYVRKPVDFEQFADAIRQLSLYWLLINEIPTRKA